MADQRRAGLIQVQVDGAIQEAVGDFTYNLGAPARETLVGSDAVHGYKEAPQAPFIEGELRDRGTLDLAALVRAKNVTVSLQLANGKLVMLRDAWFASEGTASTGEATIPVRWDGLSAEEIS